MTPPTPLVVDPAGPNVLSLYFHWSSEIMPTLNYVSTLFKDAKRRAAVEYIHVSGDSEVWIYQVRSKI